jgi:hypothetical protein
MKKPMANATAGRSQPRPSGVRMWMPLFATSCRRLGRRKCGYSTAFG